MVYGLMINCVNELDEYLRSKENIYLYGAGKIAHLIYNFIKKNNIQIMGFIVSKQGDNPFYIDGCPVYVIDKFSDLERADLILATSSSKMFEMMDFLLEYNFLSLACLSDECISELRQKEAVWNFQTEFNKSQCVYGLEYFSNSLEKLMGIMYDKKSGYPCFRVLGYSNTDGIDLLQKYCNMEVYEKQFGILKTLPKVYRNNSTISCFKINRIEIYIATSHLDKMRADDIRKMALIPIQVGASLTDMRKGCQTDDVADNISLRNRDYCECTGLYWIWKNTSGQNYVGIEHYRRRLKIDDGSISFMIDNDVDLVLALPQFVMKKTYDFFVDCLIYRHDWNLMCKFVLAYDESYREILEKYDESWFYFSCNLCLFKREWFDRYCEFAFAVAFQIEEEYRMKGVYRNDRYMGYIFENLLSLFVMKHYNDMNVVCTEVEWVE
jgi:hypothetical protein